MAKFSYLPENKRYTIIHLKDGGYSMRQIAAKVPCDLSTVVRTLKRFSETNFIADRRRSGQDRTWEVERGQFYDPVRSLCKCLRPEASMVLIYRPNVAGMKGRVDLAQPVNRTPDLWCGSPIYYYSILFSEK
ncbi:hypothetical protein TNCV_3039891 [Trichonephila clavipes]|uniref:Uncharacterized protein n=1 Tax=Trichonephila clavipes TaxID=2585209 RepID=A0A8X6RVF1_TRICX|nr:hypothetical protein TNCV_3039891 [Trichonephila clavipes]